MKKLQRWTNLRDAKLVVTALTKTTLDVLRSSGAVNEHRAARAKKRLNVVERRVVKLGRTLKHLRPNKLAEVKTIEYERVTSRVVRLETQLVLDERVPLRRARVPSGGAGSLRNFSDECTFSRRINTFAYNKQLRSLPSSAT